ncbi:MAG TPA: DUF29 domain-containing protein, partial [Lamprocystis sp. (in: g-proteobacteria)]|nr:DUF29 domain-containing protein [Lamprocystis sp. (in: g-proteobacteria)]
MSTAFNPHLYHTDVIAWAEQQARLLRAGQFLELDIKHLVCEVEDIAKAEQRELARRMIVLLTSLLKWQIQCEHRGSSWRNTIAAQRRALALRIQRTPSLTITLRDPDWWAQTWADAVAQATAETGFGKFPPACPWRIDVIL